LASLRKEVQMYEREVTEQQEKISKMQQEGRDEADIHKQVLSRTTPCTKRRINNS
jgi:hypothetical protein